MINKKGRNKEGVLRIFVVLIPFVLAIVVLAFKGLKVDADCSSSLCGWHNYCGCVGKGGCVYRTTCLSDEVSMNCGAASLMCCHRGVCQTCTPSCGSGYQEANNNCASKVFSCHDTYCTGGSCGSERSKTCYRQKYTVTIDGNGGSCSPTSQTPCGDTASTAPTNCSRSGYSLNGFTITSGSCGGTFTASTGVCSKVTEDITIQANWTIINSYTVTVKGNGATSCNPGTHTVNYGSSSQNPGCTRTGYTLSSYSITSGSSNCGTFNSSTGVCSSVKGDVSIQANWIINTYLVSVDGNNATSCNPGSHYVDYGSSSQNPGCTRTGYTLSSYSITSGSSNCGTFNSSTGVCSSVKGDVSIQANWTINSYTVTVKGNGATSCNPGTHTVNYGSSSQNPGCTRTGYTLSSYSITSGSSNCGTFNSSTGVCSSVKGDVSIQANWIINTYLVSVDGNNATSCNPGSHYVDYGSSSQNPGCTRTGYTLSSYSITSGSSNCGTFNSSTGVCSSVTGKVSIQANWTCVPITKCNCSPLSDTSTTYGSKTITCANGCGGTASSTCWCTSACTPTPCPTGTSESGTHGTYATYTCNNGCKDYNRVCKCTSACVPTSCPSGTTETNTGDYYDNYDCINDCSESQNRSCYCTICTPPTCSSIGYNDTNLGYGQVPNEKTPSCRNGQGAPDQILRCDKTYRKCYCYSCLKQCPTPLSNTGDAKLILNDFRECTNDCSVKPPEDQDDCYEEESPQPTESLSITVNRPDYTNHYGFFSNTHTGDWIGNTADSKGWIGHLNDPFNPAIKMKAEYTDSDGASDIEGLFVWFRGSQYTGELGTPLYISNSAVPKASAKDSWGFMLRRDGSGWRPYVPSYNGSNVFWTSKDINNNDKVFSIKGTNGEQMVEVTITSGPIEDGNTVSIDFSLRFSDSNGDLFPGNVSEGLYKIYLMGLDKFSFTPYDNYGINYENYWSEGFLYDDPNKQEDFSPFWQPNQLRYKAEQNQKYARDWTDTGKTWTIDRTGPQIETFAFGLPQENKLEVHWSVSDDKSLYSIVGNIYVSDELSAKQIELSADNSNISLHIPNPFFPKKTNEEDVGKLDGDWSFKVGPNMSSSTDKNVLYIDVGDNTAGLFEIYLTVFDDAGNVANSVISINIADWIATAGGVAYSAEGSYFSTKNLTSFDAKNSDLPFPTSNPGLSLDKADISSELWGENLDQNPQALVKSLIAKSYNITRYTGYKLANGYYDTLKKEFNMNKQNVIDLELEQVFPKSPDLAGSLSMICNKKTYCMFDYVGDLNIKNDVICDNKSVLFVAKNLIIDAPIKNTSDNKLSNKNGCIFVVQGDVLIKKGEDMSGSKLGYDIIHGYILADGIITIEDERPNNVTLDVMYKDIVDGIYINGGLSSSYKEDISIKINRHLRIEEKLTYPVLVIDYHPKYGVIAEIFFGRKNSIKSVEVGVKP